MGAGVTVQGTRIPARGIDWRGGGKHGIDESLERRNQRKAAALARGSGTQAERARARVARAFSLAWDALHGRWSAVE